MLLPNFLLPLCVTTLNTLNTFTLLAVFFVLHHCLFHPCWSVVLSCISFPSPAPLPFLLPFFYAPQPMRWPSILPRSPGAPADIVGFSSSYSWSSQFSTPSPATATTITLSILLSLHLSVHMANVSSTLISQGDNPFSSCPPHPIPIKGLLHP